MSGQRHNYDAFKNEHAKADMERGDAPAAEQEQAAQPTWQEELQAKFEKQREALHEKYKAGRINSREMLWGERNIERNEVIEYAEKEKQLAKERGETPEPFRPYEEGPYHHDKDRERDR